MRCQEISYRTLQPSKPQWYDAWFLVFDQEPIDSYFITWLSREQGGRRWLLKTSAEAMVIKNLLNNEMRGNPKRKLSSRRSVRTLCHTHIAAQPAVQIEQDLVRSSHDAACTNCGHLFLSLSVGYQDFGC